MIGKTISNYRVTSELGKGGMGEVWRAQDTRLGRDVALKVLPDSFAQDPERLERFEREARVLAALCGHGFELFGRCPVFTTGCIARRDDQLFASGCLDQCIARVSRQPEILVTVRHLEYIVLVFVPLAEFVLDARRALALQVDHQCRCFQAVFRFRFGPEHRSKP